MSVGMSNETFMYTKIEVSTSTVFLVVQLDSEIPYSQNALLKPVI